MCSVDEKVDFDHGLCIKYAMGSGRMDVVLTTDYLTTSCSFY